MKWNVEVGLALQEIEETLELGHLDKGGEEYAMRVILLLRDLQSKLRQKALGLPRITHDDSQPNAPYG